jgi:voltage-gated potassium channel
MTAAQPSGHQEVELNSGILPGNVRPDDFIFLALAIASAALLGVMVLDPPGRDTGLWIFYADVALGVVFLLEFFWRWRKRAWRARFLRRNWYEILAVLPVAHPDVQTFRVVTVVVLLARLARVVDRTLGEQFFLRMVERFSDPIVLAVKKPITIAVLDEVVKVLETGNYPENLAKSLTANKAELQTIISEKIAEDRQLGMLRRLPFSGEIVEAVVDTSFRVVLEVLRDPRIDAFFAAVVRDNREQIRQAVAAGLSESQKTDELLGTEHPGAALRPADRGGPGRSTATRRGGTPRSAPGPHGR